MTVWLLKRLRSVKINRETKVTTQKEEGPVPSVEYPSGSHRRPASATRLRAEERKRGRDIEARARDENKINEMKDVSSDHTSHT